MKCVIVDDEPLARKGIKQNIDRLKSLTNLGECSNINELYKFLNEHKPDLIFLDIKMPKISGLEFLRSLKEKPLVILTTAYSEHALEAFELDVVDYLLKPISFERFLKAVQKAERIFNEKESERKEDKNYIYVKADNNFVKIKIEDILYCEGLKDYVYLHTTAEKHIVLINLKNIQQQLPGNQFIRVHKSYLVSKEKISSLQGNRIFIGEQEIPIGKAYRQDVYDSLLGGNLIER